MKFTGAILLADDNPVLVVAVVVILVVGMTGLAGVNVHPPTDDGIDPDELGDLPPDSNDKA